LPVFRQNYFCRSMMSHRLSALTGELECAPKRTTVYCLHTFMIHVDRLKLFLVALATIVVFSCKGQNVCEKLHSRICDLMKKSDAIGASVIAVKDNMICYQESFGYNPDYNDSVKRNPIKSDDIFRIASISKTFVATAIMQLVEKRLINLDEDINRYLNFNVRNPRFPESPITVRMLLNHHSSITDYQYEKYRNSLAIFNPKTGKEINSLFENYKPGTKYKYSNYGYNLLGAIVENVSQVRFDEYIEKNILTPLGIYGGYNVSKIDSIRFIWAYHYDKKRKKYTKSPQMYKPFIKETNNYILGESTALFSPAGGMKLSVPDLAKYMMMHMNYGTYNGVRILTKESEEELWKVGSKTKYGMGFMHANFKLKGVDLIGHQGGAYGIHSTMFFNPEEKYGFIVVCNGCNSGHTLDTEILKELYYCFIKK